MLKRKKYMVGLLVMALSINFINSKVALAKTNSTSTINYVVIQESEIVGKEKTGIDKNNIKWSYKLCNDGTISIWKNEKGNYSGKLEIPSNLEGLTVSRIENYGLSKCTKISSVIIPGTIKSIGESAFFGCTKLSNIEIPASLTDIGICAFENTPWLTNQRNSNALVVVNNILIDGKDATGNITIPSYITTIGKSVFADVRIDGSVHYSYGHSENITSVVISQGVKKIEKGAFYGCHNLSNIQIPTSVTQIEGNAFDGTAWVKSLEQNNKFVIVNNILISAGENASGNVTIPSNVVSILDYAFRSSNEITSVKISNGVKEIGKNAFSQCNNLSEVSIPDSVVNIGTGAFSMCKNLKNIRFSKNLTSINSWTFEFCDNLTQIDIPSGVTQIDDNAFRSCEKLTKVRVPASVTKIAENAFEGSNNLIVAYCEENSYSSNYFKNKGIDVREYKKYSADDSDIQSGDTGIATDKNNIKWRYKLLSDDTLSIAIFDDPTCESIEIPAELNGHKVTSIEERAFFDKCDNLTSVKIPEGIENIGKEAFGTCSKITSVEIPLSVKKIGDSAFSGCMGLSSVTIPNKVAGIGEYAFSYNTNIKIGISNTTNNTTSNGTQTTTGTVTPTVNQGWHKEGYYWYWLWSDGSKRTGWYNEDGNWYYFYGNGQMATEFIELGKGFNYYLKPNSVDGKAPMVTGWQKINGDWFYFNPVSDGFKGMMKRGWIYDGNAWYYLYSTGQMAYNTTIEGYYVDSSGAWVK